MVNDHGIRYDACFSTNSQALIHEFGFGKPTRVFHQATVDKGRTGHPYMLRCNEPSSPPILEDMRPAVGSSAC
jgi:hypothetical protein